jgi:FlaA1/EpsC-like NDP-sugar epimerase
MKRILKMLLRPNQNKRAMFFIVCDIALLTFSLYLAFLFRFEFEIPVSYANMFARALPLLLATKLSIMVIFGVYKIIWRYVDINELRKIYFSTMIAESILMVIFLIPLDPLLSYLPLPYIAGFPRSVFFMDAIISSSLLSFLRLSKRLYLEKVIHRKASRLGVKTLIIGAGRAGEMVLRDISHGGVEVFYPVGLLDDDQNKLGGYIHGIKVVGGLSDLKWAIKKYEVEAVIIAIPSLNHRALRDIFDYAKVCRLKTVKIVPRIYDYQNPDIKIRKLEDISIEDLIGRASIFVDQPEINSFIQGKTVFISGAGGSIGSEISMQICSFHPEKLILFDIDETELHNMTIRIQRVMPEIFGRCHFIAGDIRDSSRLDDIFSNLRPDIVFHAAAYKHVPMMEMNPHESVKVNIFGTFSMASVAARYNVSKFIFISTDKAIRPTSVMGASKRICEYICRAFNETSGSTEYLSVRFGNVLGSRGSVLPLFLDQLKHGGPITVTHPDMKRYFMTIPEAVSLVLQASIIGKGGEVLVLDMGMPVSIVSLAEELISLHGLTPRTDIDIIYTGLRPGEKMFEELLTAEEGTLATRHEKIFIAKGNASFSMNEIENMLLEMETQVSRIHFNDIDSIRGMLGKYVKYHSPG